MRNARRLLAATIGLALVAIGPTAQAERWWQRHPERVDPFQRARGGGPSRRIYPIEYDAARAYHGGRGDNRWRWNPDPGNAPSGLRPPFGWPGGSPWNW